MSIYKFTDSKDSNKEYKYKVLVYPNITFQKDLEKDLKEDPIIKFEQFLDLDHNAYTFYLL